MSLKNRPFVAYYSSAQKYLFFYVFLVVGTKRKKYGSFYNAKKLKGAASHRACYDKNGETRLQAALYARQQQAIAAGGIVAAEVIRDSGETARRERCSNRKR